MNTAYFIAKKIAKPERHSFSSFIITIATIAVALSITVMVVASSMVNGFTSTIADKVFGFWGHIHINNFASAGNPLDQTAISLEESLIETIGKIDGVNSISSFATKPGILKHNDQLGAIVLKGVGLDYNWINFQDYIKDGVIPELNDSVKSRGILISETTARVMELEVGDKADIYFAREGNSRPIGRRFSVSGIYNSGLEEFDAMFIVGDIRIIQQLNGWKDREVGGYEVLVEDINRMDELDHTIYYNHLPNKIFSQTMRDIRPNIFDWLKLQSFTGRIVLIVMICIAVLNMVIALLILMLDRTYMIGTLKSLGGNNSLLQKVFLYCSGFIIIRGLMFGNIIGLGLCFIQKKYEWIKLPEDSYYVTAAPIKIDWLLITLINIGTIGICLLVLMIPAFFVMRRVSPIKAIRFD